MTLPTDYDARKAIPLLTGVIDYFIDALAEVAKVSAAGNAQHNPEAHAAGVMFWNREKSQDELNTMIRHAVERGGFDTDGVRHSAKAAWRALANLQKELEEAYGYPPPRGCIPPEQRGGCVPPAAAEPAIMVHVHVPSAGFQVDDRVRAIGRDHLERAPCGFVGRVINTEPDASGDILVQGPDGRVYWFKPDALALVSQPNPAPSSNTAK